MGKPPHLVVFAPTPGEGTGGPGVMVKVKTTPPGRLTFYIHPVFDFVKQSLCLYFSYETIQQCGPVYDPSKWAENSSALSLLQANGLRRETSSMKHIIIT